ncbi:MAG: hypothetical protein H6704_10420 [Myxococcales bacterium]|nr:hypothetical protein [Myxococcales bacterium]
MRAGQQHPVAPLDQLGIGGVGGRQPHLVDVQPPHQLGQIALGQQRDAVRIARAGEGRQVDPIGRREAIADDEAEHLDVGVAPQQHVEQVGRPTSRAPEQHSTDVHGDLPGRVVRASAPRLVTGL